MTNRPRLLAPVLATAAAVLALAAGAAGATSPPAGGSVLPLSASTGPSGVTGATGATGAGAPLSATLSACHPDILQANRYAVFAAQMTAAPEPRTLVMAVNFQLEERTGAGAGFAPVSAPGFGVWVTSQRGVGILTYSHEVTGLPAPAAFRVLVRARWLGHRHRVIHQSQRLSPVCVQAALTPDLAIGALARSIPTGAGTARYDIEVRNVGAAAVGSFEVTLSVGTTALAPITVAGLAAGAVQVVRFAGPSCTAGDTLSAAADPSGAIAEPANPKRTRAFACPRP